METCLKRIKSGEKISIKMIKDAHKILLKAVSVQSERSIENIEKIVQLRRTYLKKIQKSSIHVQKLAENLFS